MELDGLGHAPGRRPAIDLELSVRANAGIREMGQAGARRYAAGVRTAPGQERDARTGSVIGDQRVLVIGVKDRSRLLIGGEEYEI
jgi:hypothetical protein